MTTTTLPAFSPANLAENRLKRLVREHQPVLRHTTESNRYSVPIKAEEASMSSTTGSTLPMTVAETVTTLPRSKGRPKAKKAAGDLGRIRKPRVAKHQPRLTDGIDHPVTVRMIAAPIDLDER